MKIKNIKIQNFYSFESTEVNFDKFKNIILIKGQNKDAKGSNGSGKSAFIEAIYFGLTGKTIRKSTEDAMVHVKHKKKCLVELTLDNGMKITRQKKPSKLHVLIDGKDETKESIAKTQQYIDEVLNLNYKVLLSSMFFGQGNSVTFLECSAEDKRNIIKNFLDLDDIFSMRDRIKSHKAGFYNTMKEQDSLIAEHVGMIDEFDKKIGKIKKAKEKFAQYQGDVLSLSLEEILDLEEAESSRVWQMRSTKQDIDNSTKKIEELTKESRKAPQKITSEWCGDLVEKKVNKEALSDEIKFHQKQRELLQEEIYNLEDAEVDIPISSKEFTKVLAFKELCRDQTNYEGLIDSYKKKIETRNEVKAENKLNYEVMRFWEKAFSQQGIIKFIIRNILDYLNNKVNYYLSFLTNSKYSLFFDEELNEKVITNDSDIQYISLSGGEKRKVNLAVTMALKDLLLLTDKNQTNVLFLDEIAENLDEEGITGLHNLLQEIKKDKLIFIITHNKYLKTLLHSAPRLSIIKSKGVSKITKWR